MRVQEFSNTRNALARTDIKVHTKVERQYQNCKTLSKETTQIFHELGAEQTFIPHHTSSILIESYVIRYDGEEFAVSEENVIHDIVQIYHSLRCHCWWTSEWRNECCESREEVKLLNVDIMDCYVCTVCSRADTRDDGVYMRTRRTRIELTLGIEQNN